MKYNLYVSWAFVDCLVVEADSEVSARLKVHDQIAKGLPTTGVYLADSFEINHVEPVSEINLDEPNIILIPVKEEITRDRLPNETGEEYHWRQVRLENAGLLPPTDELGYPIED